METVLDIRGGKTGRLGENALVREERDGGAGILRLSDDRQKAPLQLQVRLSLFVAVMVDLSVQTDLDVHPGRQGINHGRAHAVQST